MTYKRPNLEIATYCSSDLLPGEQIRPPKNPWFMSQYYRPEKYITDPTPLEKIGLEYLADNMKKTSSRTLLDVGCLYGYVFDWFSQKRPGYLTSYTGIDINPGAIDEAKKLHAEDMQLDFHTADLFDLGPQDYTADAVLCSRVLLHLPDFNLAVEKLWGLANRMLVLFLPIAKESKAYKYTATEPNTKETAVVYYQLFSKEEIHAAAQACNARAVILRDGKHGVVLFTAGG